MSSFKMFEGLFESKFHKKCKSYLKDTKIRLETIRKKRNAMQKFWRNDIAVLLENGLDINAYAKAEKLLAEMNISDCYNLIEEFSECICNHLGAMDKQMECPEECREAVSSLIYAAARFADLPELRALRSLFMEKYGKSLEAFISKEFVEKLRVRHPTTDMKLQLMQEIAQDAPEASLHWDSKTLEQKLQSPSLQDQPTHPSTESSYDENVPRKANPDVGRKWTEYVTTKIDSRTTADDCRLRISRENEDARRDQDRRPKKQAAGENTQNPFYYGLVPPPYSAKSRISPSSNYSASLRKLVVKEVQHHSDDDVLIEINEPKSLRRRKLRPLTSNTKTENSDGDPRRGLQVFISDDLKDRGRAGQHSRGASLPEEPENFFVEEAGQRERDYSLPPQGMSSHVHSNLPDYDELADKIAALSVSAR